MKNQQAEHSLSSGKGRNMKSGFEAIYQAALKKDSQAIKKCLEFNCIDEWGPQYSRYSALTQLANEGKKESVAFLISKGANVNYAVLGAGLSGDFIYAEHFIATHKADLNWLARGAALGGYEEYIENLLTRGARIETVAKYTAQAGFVTYALQLLNRGAHPKHVILGLARGGHFTAAEQLLIQAPDLIHYFVEGLAEGGHTAYSEELLARGASIDYAAYGAAVGGYYQYAEELLQRGANVRAVAWGASVAGHRSYIESLLIRQQISLDFAACYFSKNGHHLYVEELLNRGANKKQVLEAAIKGKQLSKKFESQLHYFSLFQEEMSSQLIHTLSETKKLPPIPKRTKKKIILFRRYFYRKGLGYAQSRFCIESRCQNLCFILRTLTMHYPLYFSNLLQSCLPNELWFLVFQYLAPVPLTAKQYNSLGFLFGQILLKQQLNRYALYCCSNCKSEAKKAQKEITLRHTNKTFASLLSQQEHDLSIKNQCGFLCQEKQDRVKREKILSEYYEMIHNWHRALLVDDPSLEEPSSLIKKKERSSSLQADHTPLFFSRASSFSPSEENRCQASPSLLKKSLFFCLFIVPVLFLLFTALIGYLLITTGKGIFKLIRFPFLCLFGKTKTEPKTSNQTNPNSFVFFNRKAKTASKTAPKHKTEIFLTP